jgi:hypothetical protein
VPSAGVLTPCTSDIEMDGLTQVYLTCGLGPSNP